MSDNSDRKAAGFRVDANSRQNWPLWRRGKPLDSKSEQEIRLCNCLVPMRCRIGLSKRKFPVRDARERH